MAREIGSDVDPDAIHAARLTLRASVGKRLRDLLSDLYERHLPEGPYRPDAESAGKRALRNTALDLLAHMCVANSAIATMQARGWEASSGNKGFYPIDGFTMIGMDWSAITNGNLGVVVGSREADYELAYKLLAELGGAG